MYGAADRAVDDCRPADDGTLEREAGRSTRPYRCRVAAAALQANADAGEDGDRGGAGAGAGAGSGAPEAPSSGSGDLVPDLNMVLRENFEVWADMTKSS